MITVDTSFPASGAAEGVPLVGLAPTHNFQYLRIDLNGHVILSEQDVERIVSAVVSAIKDDQQQARGPMVYPVPIHDD